MATKLKSIKYLTSIKVLAACIIIILMSFSCLVVFMYVQLYDNAVSDEYYDTDNFAHEYYEIAHRVLENYIYLRNEEQIAKFYEEETVSDTISNVSMDSLVYQHKQFMNEFRSTSVFLFYLENVDTHEIITNVQGSDPKEQLLNMSTSVIFENEYASYPEASDMGKFVTFINQPNEYNYHFMEVLRIQGDIRSYYDEDWLYITAYNSDEGAIDPYFYDGKERHDLFLKYKIAFNYILIPSLLLSLLLIVYLVIYSGKTSKEEKPQLSYYDTVHHEVQTMMTIVMFIVLLRVWSDIDYHYLQKLGQQKIIFIFIAIFLAAGFVQFLSIVRLIKCHKFWDNWLCVKLLKLIINIFRIPKLDNNYKVKVSLRLLLYSVAIFISIIILYEFFLIGLIMFAGINLYTLKQIFRVVDDVNLMAEDVHSKRLHGIYERGSMEIQTPSLQSIAEDIEFLYEGLDKAIEERMRGEKMKTDLITNVTHDLKNPLTSIISYVTLLKDSEVQNQEAKGYIDVLDEKAKRLKNLIEQLVEASKASSGNIDVEMQEIDFVQLNRQVQGDYEEKFAEKGLELILNEITPPIMVCSDPNVLYRIMDNLMSNVEKYALESSRVYMDIETLGKGVRITLKNISKERLNISIEDLTKRFVRGDESRTEEGSGLGLSIAMSLAKLIHIDLELSIDGDLFKAVMDIPDANCI